jgi:hypothetical protein
VSRVGGGFMVAPLTVQTAGDLGLSFFEFYLLGRAGVLGPVNAEQVAVQLDLLEPDMVAEQWRSGLAKADPIVVATQYARCCQEWGRNRLQQVDGLGDASRFARRIVASMDLVDLPLVAGWRALRLPGEGDSSDCAAGLAQLLQTMREYRGALHARAVRQAELTPVEAIVAGPDGPQRAAQLGWPEPYPDPASCSERRAVAELRTDALAAAQFGVLSDSERVEWVALCGRLLRSSRTT